MSKGPGAAPASNGGAPGPRDGSGARRGTARTPAALAVAVLTATATVGWALPAYREGPPPGHTGGFGEPLCSECHFGGPVNAEPGSLKVDAPAGYAPGETYTLTVALAHPELAAAGFQLALRFADGPGAGEQAGVVRAPDVRTAITVDSGVAYAHQTPDGATPTGPGAARWTVAWTAPDSDAAVVLHVSANVANDDASEFGDRIYGTSVEIRPSPRRVDDLAVPVHLWVFDREDQVEPLPIMER